MKPLPFISIVCLNWNSATDIMALLKSVYQAQYSKSKREIIVVDNASTDNSVNLIKQHFPQTKIIALKQNQGMPALNHGYKQAQGKYIFSLQSDVAVAPDLFIKAVEKLESDSTIGLLGVKVYQKKTNKILPPTIGFNFYTGEIYPIKLKQESSMFDYLEGLCHVFPKKILTTVGFIDQTYFFYGDDPDFCFRIKTAGYKLIYYPDTFVLHGKAKSSAKVFPYKYHHYYKAIFNLVFKYGNICQKLTVVPFQLLIIPIERLLTQKPVCWLSRWWGLAWNIRTASLMTKILLFSAFLGLGLRIYLLFNAPFWFDEVFTYLVVKLPIHQLVSAVLTDNNPPFYYLLMHFWLKVSENQVWLRLPSLVANLASGYFLYKTVANVSTKKTAQVTTAFFLLSPLTIYLSHTARLHSLAIFGLTLLIWLGVKLKQSPSGFFMAIFIFVSSLALHTQYYLLLAWLIIWLFLLFTKPINSQKFAWKILTITFVSFVPWLMLAAPTRHNPCSCPNSILSLPASIASPILGGIGEVSLRRYLELPNWVTAFFALVGSYNLYFLIKGINRQKFIVFLYLLPLGLLTLAGLFYPVFTPKGFAIFSPLFFALVSLGMIKYKNATKLALLNVVLLLLINFYLLTNPFFFGSFAKNMINQVSQNPTLDIYHTSSITYFPFVYYIKTAQSNFLLTQNPYPPPTVSFIGGEEHQLDQDNIMFWLVDTANWVDQQERQNILEQIAQNYQQVKNYQYNQAILSLWQKKAN